MPGNGRCAIHAAYICAERRVRGAVGGASRPTEQTRHSERRPRDGLYSSGMLGIYSRVRTAVAIFVRWMVRKCLCVSCVLTRGRETHVYNM